MIVAVLLLAAGIYAAVQAIYLYVHGSPWLLDAPAIDFLRSHEVSIGISLDAATPAVADRTRRTWDGRGV